MLIFKHIPDPKNEFDTDTIIFKSDAMTLPEVLESFKNFLKGVGYQIDGKDLILVDNELISEMDDQSDSELDDE